MVNRSHPPGILGIKPKRCTFCEKLPLPAGVRLHVVPGRSARTQKDR